MQSCIDNIKRGDKIYFIDHINGINPINNDVAFVLHFTCHNIYNNNILMGDRMYGVSALHLRTATITKIIKSK